MPVNTVFSWFIRKRLHQIDLFRRYPLDVQAEGLRYHLEATASTAFGREHGITADTTPEAYRRQVPLRDYNGMKPWIERVRDGETDVLWPGSVKWHAKSSGTTSDRSKFIPVTEAALERCHYLSPIHI